MQQNVYLQLFSTRGVVSRASEGVENYIFRVVELLMMIEYVRDERTAHMTD